MFDTFAFLFVHKHWRKLDFLVSCLMITFMWTPSIPRFTRFWWVYAGWFLKKEVGLWVSPTQISSILLSHDKIKPTIHCHGICALALSARLLNQVFSSKNHGVASCLTHKAESHIVSVRKSKFLTLHYHSL